MFSERKFHYEADTIDFFLERVSMQRLHVFKNQNADTVKWGKGNDFMGQLQMQKLLQWAAQIVLYEHHEMQGRINQSCVCMRVVLRGRRKRRIQRL